MEAFKCDGCDEFFKDKPMYTLERTDGVVLYTEMLQYHFHSWLCIGLLVDKSRGSKER